MALKHDLRDIRYGKRIGQFSYFKSRYYKVLYKLLSW